MLAIARAEALMLVRNRLVATLAILTPLAFGVVLLLNRGNLPQGAAGILAGMQVLVMASMGTYATAVTTLAARRQTLFLKRLRGGVLADGAILAGLLTPVALINLVQVGVLLAVADVPPASPVLVAAAVLAAQAMFVAFALATAGVTTSPEHAQFTTLPLLLVTVSAAMWVGFSRTDDLAVVQRIVPGGGLMEWIAIAWNGGDASGMLWGALATLVWVAVGVFAARRAFRWEPRG